jgi:hypothetical protein
METLMRLDEKLNRVLDILGDDDDGEEEEAIDA